MRRDLKFGLTIGAVLVVTLLVYVIVLSRGSGVGTAPPTAVAISTGNTLPGDAIASGHVDLATPAKPSPSTPAVPDIAANAGVPATQPAPVDRTDWNGALEHGLPPTLSAAAPQQTVTPTIDGPSVTLPYAVGGVSRGAATPVIDPLPTTQPAPQIVAAPSPAVPSAPAASGTRTHRVAAGETPSSIAAAVYGNAKFYPRILAANPGIDPRRLKIGQVLVIPELTDAGAAPVATDAASSAIDPTSAYKVVSGDTLEKIARKLYGGIELKEKLYQLNKTLIGPDENVLKVGWVLKLPEAPKVASTAQ